MDLKGAALRNFYEVTRNILETSGDFNPSIVKIPHYQRPYKWGADQIRKLILDWEEESQGGNSDNNYFAGAIVTVSQKETHDLIDGQQRYTTIFLSNFVRFLVLRVAIRQEINKGKLTRLRKLVDSLIMSSKFAFADSENFISEISALFEEIEKLNDQDKDDECATSCQKLLSAIGLPTLVEDDANYDQQHLTMLDELISTYDLGLTYDRISFNKTMQKILANCKISLRNSP